MSISANSLKKICYVVISLAQLENLRQIDHSQPYVYQIDPKNLVKISPVHSETIGLKWDR